MLTHPPFSHQVSRCLLVCSVIYCLQRCQSCISHPLTGSISQSRLTEQAFELYSLLLFGNETDMTAQLWRGCVTSVSFYFGCRCLSVLPNTQTFSPETLYLLKFQSSRELRAGEPPGGGWGGGTATLI